MSELTEKMASKPQTQMTTMQGRKAQLQTLMEKMKDQMVKVLPAYITPERFARTMLTCMNQNPRLYECTTESLLGAMMTCASLALEMGVLGQAWPVPFNNKGKMECTLMIGYKGYVELFYRSTMVKDVQADTVYENDFFEFEKGNNAHLKFVRSFGDRGKEKCWYAQAILTNGGGPFVVMDKKDVDRIRAKSKSKDSPAWTQDYNAMACKCCVKQLEKFVPKGAIARDVQKAFDAEENLIKVNPNSKNEDDFFEQESIDAEFEIQNGGGPGADAQPNAQPTDPNSKPTESQPPAKTPAPTPPAETELDKETERLFPEEKPPVKTPDEKEALIIKIQELAGAQGLDSGQLSVLLKKHHGHITNVYNPALTVEQLQSFYEKLKK